FPVVVSAVAGFTTTPAELADLARSLSASRWQTFRKVRLPGALPQIFIGLKVAIGLAVIGAVISEFTGAPEGLGYAVNAYSGQGRTPEAFAALILLSVLSIALFYLAGRGGAAAAAVGPGNGRLSRAAPRTLTGSAEQPPPAGSGHHRGQRLRHDPGMVARRELDLAGQPVERRALHDVAHPVALRTTRGPDRVGEQPDRVRRVGGVSGERAVLGRVVGE